MKNSVSVVWHMNRRDDKKVNWHHFEQYFSYSYGKITQWPSTQATMIWNGRLSYMFSLSTLVWLY